VKSRVCRDYALFGKRLWICERGYVSSEVYRDYALFGRQLYEQCAGRDYALFGKKFCEQWVCRNQTRSITEFWEFAM